MRSHGIRTTTVTQHATGDDITGDDNFTATTATTSTITESGSNAAGSYTLTTTKTVTQTRQQQGDDVSGGYSATLSDDSTTVNQETNAAGGYTETVTDDSTGTETGDSVTGDATTTTSGTLTSDLQDQAGDVAVTEDSSGTYTLLKTSNSITGDYSLSRTDTASYSMTETGSNFTLGESGSNTWTTEETGNTQTGAYSRSVTGSDGYTLTETGSNAAGNYSETVQGSESYTQTETGNTASQAFSRTEGGSGTYTRRTTAPGPPCPATAAATPTTARRAATGVRAASASRRPAATATACWRRSPTWRTRPATAGPATSTSPPSAIRLPTRRRCSFSPGQDWIPGWPRFGRLLVQRQSGGILSWDNYLGRIRGGGFDNTSNFFAGWSDSLTFGMTGGFRALLGYNDVVDPTSLSYNIGVGVGAVHNAGMGNYWGTAYGVSTLAANYGQWSLDNQGSSLALNAGVARWVRLAGRTGQAVTAVCGLAKPAGFLWQVSPAASLVVTAFGINGLRNWWNALWQADKSKWTVMDWADNLLPPLAGLAAGFSPGAIKDFRQGMASGAAFQANPRAWIDRVNPGGNFNRLFKGRPAAAENPPVLEEAPTVQSRFDELAQIRQQRGMPNTGNRAADGVVAKLEINGQEFFDVNGHGKGDGATWERLAEEAQAAGREARMPNLQSQRHAEGGVFFQAAPAGVRGGRAHLFVDADVCGCATSQGIRNMLRCLGIDEVIVHTPNCREGFVIRAYGVAGGKRL